MKMMEHKIRIKSIILKIALFGVLASICGCSGNYGRLAVNNDVKLEFERYEILSDHQYYYSGSIARPRAIIGIQEAYTLQSDLWVAVDLTQDQLKGWIDYYGPSSKFSMENKGSDILNSEGQKIGVWYALVNWRDYATVKMIGEKVVQIGAPIEQGKDKKDF